MKSLYIMGTPGSGKTVVALGLAQKLQQEGYRVGYFKPVASVRKLPGSGDMDSVLMKKVLNLKAPLEIIAPVSAGPFYLSTQTVMKDALARIRDALRDFPGADLVIIDGALSMDILGSCGLDCVTLAKTLGSCALLVLKVENDYSLDNALFLNRHLALEGVPVAGNIFSNVPRPLHAKTDGVYRPILEKAGYKTLGVFPSRLEIAYPTVAEFYDVLGGEILAAHEHLNLPVEDVVGAMTIAGALTYCGGRPTVRHLAATGQTLLWRLWRQAPRC